MTYDLESDILTPRKFQFLYRPSRYKVAFGGRGGGRSWQFARGLLICATNGRERVLCTREYQNSIKESVHYILKNQIERMGLSSLFTIKEQSITGPHDSEFVFAGLKSDPHKIKSTEGITKCWVEEAEKVSKASWEMLIPTIREPDSEIWVGFNPDLESDPTYQMFIIDQNPDAVVQKINWRDNPWFPEVLQKERDYMRGIDLDAYMHIWEGECRKRTDAQILKEKYVVQDFEPELDWDGPYQGADWGFAVDPATLVRCWVYRNKLYIEHEFWGLGVEIDALASKFEIIPDSANYVTRADSARPETISYLKRKGYPKIIGVKKWKGSIEDGIAYLRAFEKIIIHPRCTHTIEEARLWSYKVDRLTGDILPEVVDTHNHCWDGIRYALEPIIRAGQNIGFYDGCDFN
ncbi:MAG: PBSX family phage terminase large subunit [Methanoregula sp.]